MPYFLERIRDYVEKEKKCESPCIEESVIIATRVLHAFWTPAEPRTPRNVPEGPRGEFRSDTKRQWQSWKVFTRDIVERRTKRQKTEYEKCWSVLEKKRKETVLKGNGGLSILTNRIQGTSYLR